MLICQLKASLGLYIKALLLDSLIAIQPTLLDTYQGTVFMFWNISRTAQNNPSMPDY
jgi:hypothetical protein